MKKRLNEKRRKKHKNGVKGLTIYDNPDPGVYIMQVYHIISPPLFTWIFPLDQYSQGP